MDNRPVVDLHAPHAAAGPGGLHAHDIALGHAARALLDLAGNLHKERLAALVPEAGPSPLDPRSDRGPPRKRVRLPSSADDAATDTGWTWGEE